MALRSLLLLVPTAIAATAILGAQDQPRLWDPKKEPPPRHEDWLPQRKISPDAVVVHIEPPRGNTCAIPLLEAQPNPDGAIPSVRQMQPKHPAIIRYVEPPSPACDSATVRNGGLIEVDPRRPR